MGAWKDGKTKWKEGVKVWKMEDATAKGMLDAVLPNTIFVEILGRCFKTFREMCEAVERRMERNTLYRKANIELRAASIGCTATN